MPTSARVFANRPVYNILARGFTTCCAPCLCVGTDTATLSHAAGRRGATAVQRPREKYLFVFYFLPIVFLPIPLYRLQLFKNFSNRTASRDNVDTPRCGNVYDVGFSRISYMYLFRTRMPHKEYNMYTGIPPRRWYFIIHTALQQYHRVHTILNAILNNTYISDAICSRYDYQ